MEGEQEWWRKFHDEFPEETEYTPSFVNNLRQTHYPHLQGSIYLDNAGTVPPSKYILQQSFEYLSTHLLGNPHSTSKSSILTTQRIDLVREQILSLFSVKSDKYSIIFTSGCTMGLKLIGESFPFTSSSILRLMGQNHTSAVGLREYAFDKGASVQLINYDFDNEDSTQNFVIKNVSPYYSNSNNINNNNNNNINTVNNEYNNEYKKEKSFNLFVYPAESNFDGEKYPLNLVHNYHQLDGNWKVLIDISALVSTSFIDLNEFPFDYVTFSFHKIFGYPTGLGALLVRNNEAGEILKNKYFAGGTVEGVLTTERFHQSRSTLHERFEMGTIPFSSISTLPFSFDFLKSLGGFPSIQKEKRYSYGLSQYLFNELEGLYHNNNQKVCKIFGRHFDNNQNNNKTKFERISERQGNILTFQLYRSNGEIVGHKEVEKLASASNIQLRTGCFCNPSACQSSLKLQNEDLLAHLEAGHVCWDDLDIINQKATGLVRLSISYVNNWNDCFQFVEFIKRFFVERTLPSIENSTDGNDQSNEEKDTTKKMQLKSIIFYPIKSCGGIEVEEWFLNERGLLFDREWILVDNLNQTLNGKLFPSLCLFKPQINLSTQTLRIHFRPPNQNIHLENDKNTKNIDDNNDNNEGFVPSGKYKRSRDFIDISFASKKKSIVFLGDETGGNHEDDLVIKLRVCGDVCEGRGYEERINEWFSDRIGKKCKLVRNTAARSCDSIKLSRSQTHLQPLISPQIDHDNEYSNKSNFSSSNDDQSPNSLSSSENLHRYSNISFSNESQMLLVNEESVIYLKNQMKNNDQNEMIEEELEVTLSRFRGNLILKNLKSFDEDLFSSFSIGLLSFFNAGPCTRCRMININPLTSNISENGDPLLTLATFRRFKGQVLFGRHIVMNSSENIAHVKEIKVGDELLSLIPISVHLPFIVENNNNLSK